MNDIQKTWEKFTRTQAKIYRDELIVHYLPLVENISSSVRVNLPPSVEKDDLISAGNFGLIDAVSRFDINRGFKFETFASQRIKGAMLDYLRSIDWAPRSLRSHAREVGAKREELTGDFKRHPTNKEIAEALGWEEGEVNDILSKVNRSFHTQIEPDTSDAEIDGHQIPAPPLIDPRSLEVSLLYDDLASSLDEAITNLNDKERIVFTLFYYEGASLAEIGKLFGVTESRICQVLTQAALHCRGHLDLVR